MATIKIIDGINGSFPAQSATLVLDLLTVRTSTGGQKSYAMKSSIASLKVGAEQGDNVAFDIRLQDGSHFKAEADKRTVAYLTKFVGSQSAAPYIVSELAKAPPEQRNLLPWTVIIIVSSFLVYQCATRTENTPPPVAQPAQQLSPDELIRHQKATRDEEVRQEKGAKAAAAANAMQGIKASELLLEGAELDLKNGKLNDIDVYGIGVMLEVIYGMAHSLQEGWTNREYFTPADINHMKSAETKLLSFQQRALPKLRLAYKKQVAKVLWEHDVTVSVSGAGNTVLKLISYQFAANANVKAAEEQMEDLVTRLRFKRLIIAPSEYYKGGAVYTMQTPGDGTVAGYAGGFQKLNRQAKP